MRNKVDEALYAINKAGGIDAMWNKWLSPDTEFKLTRDGRVQPIAAVTSTPIP